MRSGQIRMDRRTLIISLAAAVAAPGVLAACSAPSAAAPVAPPPSTLAATPAKPVTLNILDVAGNLRLTKPAIEAFASAHPEVVSGVTYATGTAPQLAAKIQAQQQGGNVQIGLVLTGTDGLAAGIQDKLY